jgi:hypothetical protein
MNVKTLINLLSKLPPDAEVVELEDYDRAWYRPIKGTPALFRASLLDDGKNGLSKRYEFDPEEGNVEVVIL